MANTGSTPGKARPGRPKGFYKGSAKLTKAFLRRVDDTRALTSAIEVFKSQVTRGLGKRLAPELAEGEALPDFAFSLELVGRSVESALARLRGTERHARRCESLCARVRQESERLSRREVYPRVKSVRAIIDAQFGKVEARSIHGMAGRTRRKARRLHVQLEYLVWRLEEGAAELPPALLQGIASRSDEWLSDLRPGYERLTELLDELLELELAEKGARDDRKRATEAFDATYGEALRVVQAHVTFAGHGDTFAQRLRSVFQRRLLARRAREKREVRAEARDEARGAGRVKQTLRSVAAWISGPPKNVA